MDGQLSGYLKRFCYETRELCVDCPRPQNPEILVMERKRIEIIYVCKLRDPENNYLDDNTATTNNTPHKIPSIKNTISYQIGKHTMGDSFSCLRKDK